VSESTLACGSFGVGWIDPGKHIFDQNMNWVAYISHNHAWSAETGNWLGLLVLHVQPDQLDLLHPLAGGPVFLSGDGFHSRMNPLSLTDGVGHKFAKARTLRRHCGAGS
jgi:hypothetical protein